MTNMMYEYEPDGVRTVREVAALHPVIGGTVSVMFLTSKEPEILRVHEMNLAEVGIEVRVGSQFEATFVIGAEGPYVTDFSAIEQLDPSAVQDAVSDFLPELGM